MPVRGVLLLTCVLLACVDAETICEHFCVEPCETLNGNPEHECGACESSGFACFPGAPGFSWRERSRHQQPSAAPRFASDAPVNGSALSATFDAQHGCRKSDIGVPGHTADDNDPCVAWDPEVLPALIEPGRRFCLHAMCLGRMLAARGHSTNSVQWPATELAGYVGAPAQHMAHRFFGIRLAAAELMLALCAQLASTHLLEGAGCLAVAANHTESHDIAIRWVGVEVMGQLVTGHAHRRHWGLWGAPSWDEHAKPGGTLSTTRAADEMRRRLQHWQPGTRWMALHGLGRFARGAELPLLDDVLRSMQDDMGFPGVGLLAAEVVGRLYGGTTHPKPVLDRLAATLAAPQTELRGSTPELVRLLVLEAARRLAAHRDGTATAAAAELRANLPSELRAYATFESLATTHARPDVRAAALLVLAQLGEEAPKSAAAAAAVAAADKEPIVRCAAGKALAAMAPHGEPASEDDCEGDWAAAQDAYTGARHEAPSRARESTVTETSAGEEAPSRARESTVTETSAGEEAVLAAEATLARLAVAPPSAEAASLCMLYLSSVASHSSMHSEHVEGMYHRLRWRALLTLPLVAPRPCLTVRTQALGLMRSDEITDRYLGMKALSLTAERGDIEVAAALVAALSDWVDVIKLQAAEHLVDLTARTAPAVIRTAQLLLTKIVDDKDLYTRFAAAVGLRKLAALCTPRGEPKEGREQGREHGRQSVEEMVGAVLLGQLHSSATALARVAKEIGLAFEACAPDEELPIAPLAIVVNVGGAAAVAVGAADAASPASADDAATRWANAQGTVGKSHCFARLRALPESVLANALAAVRRTKHCDLTDSGQVRATGLLLVRGAISATAREVSLRYLRQTSTPCMQVLTTAPSSSPQVSLRYLNELLGNASGIMLDVKRFHGRSAYRGGNMNDAQAIHSVNPQLLDALDGLLAELDQRGLTPPLPYLTERRPLQVREIEHVVLDPAEHDCPTGEEDGVPCGCDWHVDGGMRGFKLWLPLRKEARPDAREHQNVVVAPLDEVQRLCDLVDHLSVSTNVAPRPPPLEDIVEYQTNSNGTSGWVRSSGYEVESRKRDQRALQAVGCVVPAEPGDVLLWFPGVFHRTQDVAGHRVAIIAEAIR